MKSSTIVVALIIMGLVVFTSGCDNGGQEPLWGQIKKLGREKSEFRQEVQRLQAENEDLARQVETLSSLGPQIRLDVLSRLSRIEIARRSGLFDKDNDGKKEKLIVYIRPIDDAADAVKAPGTVQVQLWDLNTDSGQALLGQWEVKPDELKKMWSATMMTNYYRLSFDVAELLDNIENELTVKVTFTDYVTGKVFRKQKVIEP